MNLLYQMRAYSRCTLALPARSTVPVHDDQSCSQQALQPLSVALHLADCLATAARTPRRRTSDISRGRPEDVYHCSVTYIVSELPVAVKRTARRLPCLQGQATSQHRQDKDAHGKKPRPIRVYYDALEQPTESCSLGQSEPCIHHSVNSELIACGLSHVHERSHGVTSERSTLLKWRGNGSSCILASMCRCVELFITPVNAV